MVAKTPSTSLRRSRSEPRKVRLVLFGYAVNHDFSECGVERDPAVDVEMEVWNMQEVVKVGYDGGYK